MRQERLQIMWGTAILDQGFTSIPNIIIRYRVKAGVTHGEWGLLTLLFTYKHDNRDPYPSIDELAYYMGVSSRQIKKWLKSLKDKKLIRVGRRRNKATKQWDTNVYNFKPLVDKCLKLAGESPLPDSKEHDIEWYDEPGEPEVHEPGEPEVHEPGEPEVPTKIKREKIKRENKNSLSRTPSDVPRQVIDLLEEKGQTDRLNDIHKVYKKVFGCKGYSDILFTRTVEKALNADIRSSFYAYLLGSMQKNMDEVHTSTLNVNQVRRDILPEWIKDEGDDNKKGKDVPASLPRNEDQLRKDIQEKLRLLGEL